MGLVCILLAAGAILVIGREQVETWGRPLGGVVEPVFVLVESEDDVALGKELTLGTDALVDAPFSIRFIPDCSHWVQQERPEEVNEALLAFLRS